MGLELGRVCTMPETWRRLKQLESRCTAEIRSTLEPDGSLCWHVVLRRRQNGPPVKADARDVTDAVREAVTQAEKEGWGSD
jgi:hypothetical protein